MTNVASILKQDPYKVEITSPTGNCVIADEPADKGGKDLGFSPKELLASALAACTSATVKMYAERKGWDLQEVQLEIALERNDDENKTQIFRKMHFIGNLDDSQRMRLRRVAQTCPIHKILTNPIEINTQLK
ncbi:OsmC family protein [Sphingobacterium sp. JB170]|uniref:OsmC family protein n=1 Tax=Sphingobacterium sp. JB170 TaxID=1434842 RepID=UPI00097EA613|nr:OsmC family protein [Sphingobacterium sp. JB170]SJN43808.1 OsmC-like family protein [Sphingobacterium sp. JB170]